MNKKQVILLACAVFQPIFEENGFEQGFDQIFYQDSGLHVYPNKLKQATQDQIDQISTPSLIVLGYGLCGNGMHGIKAGVHTLLIPRVDDCIALLMGSRGRYLVEKEKNAGTYFMTRGWLDSDANPLAEYNKTAERLGEKKAMLVMDIQYKNYSRLMFVAHQERDFTAYKSKIEPVVEFCQRWEMEYEEYLGDIDYLRQLIIIADQAEIDQFKTNENFIVVPPGGELSQMDFIDL
jgi:hypothetical protein